MNVDARTFDVAPGPSLRGVYVANHWYGHEATLLDYMDARGPISGKIQIGWQPGTGLEAEQGMKLEITHYRLPFYVWGRRHLAACAADGLGWGLAIGAPALYRPAFRAAVEARASATGDTALALPSHSSNPYWIEDGWRAWARDFRLWAKAEGLTPVACLHPADYVRNARQAVEVEDIHATCVGGVFWSGYLDRLVELFRAAVAIVTDRVCTPTFYAAALGRRAIVRGPKLVPSLARDEWCGVEFDHEALAREFPWTVTGADGHDAALVELGADCVRSPDGLRTAIFGETSQVEWWRSDPDAEAYAATPSANDVYERAGVLATILSPWLHEIGVVLEIGCGSGANLGALAEAAPNARIEGIEPGTKARSLARAAGHKVSDGTLPRIESDDNVADLVLSAGLLIHVAPELRAPCVAEMVRLSRRYLLLIEYGAEAAPWNGHLGGDDFGAILRACGCLILSHGVVPDGVVPGGSFLGTHYWLADVGNKRMPI